MEKESKILHFNQGGGTRQRQRKREVWRIYSGEHTDTQKRERIRGGAAAPILPGVEDKEGKGLRRIKGHQLVSRSGSINGPPQGKGGVDVPPINQGEVRLVSLRQALPL